MGRLGGKREIGGSLFCPRVLYNSKATKLAYGAQSPVHSSPCSDARTGIIVKSCAAWILDIDAKG